MTAIRLVLSLTELLLLHNQNGKLSLRLFSFQFEAIIVDTFLSCLCLDVFPMFVGIVFSGGPLIGPPFWGKLDLDSARLIKSQYS